jgi:hypothetical protein
MGHFEDVLEPVCLRCGASTEVGYRPPVRDVKVWARQTATSVAGAAVPAQVISAWRPGLTAY